MLCLKTAGGVAKNVDIDEMLPSTETHLSLLFAQACLSKNIVVCLSLLTMINPNQMHEVLLFVCSKMADETNLSSKLPVADRTREVWGRKLLALAFAAQVSALLHWFFLILVSVQ